MRGSSSCAYRHRPARRSHQLSPRRRPVRLPPAAPVTPPEPGWRPADQSDAFGDWFITTSAPPRRGRPRAMRSRRDRFGWLLSPWLLAPIAAVAVATTGVALSLLWMRQTAPLGTVQIRPGAAVTTAPATGGLPRGPGRPLRVVPPLPPATTPAQAPVHGTAGQSQAAGTGDTPAPAGTALAEPGPVTPVSPAGSPRPSPSSTAPAAVPPASTAPGSTEPATNTLPPPPGTTQPSPPGATQPSPPGATQPSLPGATPLSPSVSPPST